MRESTFKTRINSILKDNAINRYQANQKKGRINTKRIYKIDFSEKIFKQKLERKGKDYSITILIDVSGSMSPIGNVLQSASKLLKLFEQIDIPTSAYTFSNVTRQVKDFDEKFNPVQFEKLVRHTMDRLRYFICHKCKILDVSDTYLKKISGSDDKVCKLCEDRLSAYSNGGTDDSFALYTVATQIHKKQKKNIMIVFTDGSGSSYDEMSSYGQFKMHEPNSKILVHHIGDARKVLKKIKKMFPELVVMAVPIETSPNYCERIYGKGNTSHAPRRADVYGAVVKLLNKLITRA